MNTIVIICLLVYKPIFYPHFYTSSWYLPFIFEPLISNRQRTVACRVFDWGSWAPILQESQRCFIARFPREAIRWIHLVLFRHPSEKYEFVNGDDEIPNINGKIKSMATKPPTRWVSQLGFFLKPNIYMEHYGTIKHVPNHQANKNSTGGVLCSSSDCL